MLREDTGGGAVALRSRGGRGGGEEGVSVVLMEGEGKLVFFLKDGGGAEIVLNLVLVLLNLSGKGTGTNPSLLNNLAVLFTVPPDEDGPD